MRKTLGYTLLFCLSFLFLDGLLILLDMGKQDFFSISKGQMSALVPFALSDLVLIFLSNWLLILVWEFLLLTLPDRPRWAARLWLGAVSIFNLVIQSPEMFRWAWRPVMRLSRHLDVRAIGLVLFTVVLGLVAGWILKSRPLTKFQLLRGGVILILGLLILPWDFTFRRHSSGNADVPTNQRVLFLSVDSLRPEAAPLLVSESTPYLRKFLGELKRSEMITPIATTHAAFMSLLSGLVPTQHGVRFPIPETGLYNVKADPSTPIEQLRKYGVPIYFQADESLFMQWEAGNQADVLELPKRDLYMFAQTLLFRSRLFCGIYGGFLGRLIHPKVFSDRTHYHLYQGGLFADRVIGSVQKHLLRSTGFIHVAHTSALHWPIPARVPKSLIKGETPDASNLLDFSQEVDRARDPEWATRGSEHYRGELGELYNLAARNVGENYLEPVLRHLYTEGLIDKMLVILMSDHGESLQPLVWAGEVRQPRHGDSLLLWDDTNRAYLGVRFPPGQQAEFPRWLGIYELLPWVCERVMKLCLSAAPKGDSRVPIESGPWPSTWFPQQAMISPRSMGELFIKDFDHNQIHFSKNIQEINLVWKQRGIWSPQHKLMIYPTSLGYKVFLCAWREDRYCFRNQLRALPQIANDLLLEFDKQFAIDVARGYLPPFKGIDYDQNLALIDWSQLALSQARPGLRFLLFQLNPNEFPIPEIKNWLHDSTLPDFFRLYTFLKVAGSKHSASPLQIEEGDQEKLVWLARSTFHSCPGCLWSVLREGFAANQSFDSIRRAELLRGFGKEVSELDEYLSSKTKFSYEEIEKIGIRLKGLSDPTVARDLFFRAVLIGSEHWQYLMKLGNQLYQRHGIRFRTGSADMAMSYFEAIQTNGLASPSHLFDSSWPRMVQIETEYGFSFWRELLSRMLVQTYSHVILNSRQREELEIIKRVGRLKLEQK